MCIPNNEEVVPIDVPRLHRILRILEHDLRIAAEVGGHHRGLEVSTSAGRAVRDAAECKHSLDVEVVGELQGGVRRDERDTVDSVSLLPIDHRSGVDEPDGPGHVDHPVVVRALWVRSRATRGQISPETESFKRMNFPAYYFVAKSLGN